MALKLNQIKKTPARKRRSEGASPYIKKSTLMPFEIPHEKGESEKIVDKNNDAPATCGRIETVRSELKFEIARLSLKIDAKFQEILTEVLSIKVAVEDQKSKNLFVLDNLRSVVDIQQDLMDRVQKLERSAFGVEN